MIRKIKSILATILIGGIFPVLKIENGESENPGASPQDKSQESPPILTENEKNNENNQTPEAKLKELEAKLTADENALLEAKKQIEDLQKSTADMLAKHEQTAASLAAAVSRYKAAAIEANPAVPAELVAGDTIEAIDASLAYAKELTGKIKANLEAAAARNRVPPGAPQRTDIDLSGLSPTAKIITGLNQSQR